MMADFETLETIELDTPEDGADYDGWGIENNEILKRLSQAIGAGLAITADGGEYVLTERENTNLVMRPTAVLASALTIKTREGVQRLWLVVNDTDGAFPVGVRCSPAGAVAYVGKGRKALVWSDGVDCYALDSAALTGLNDPNGASSTTRSIRQISGPDTLVLADAGNVVHSVGGSAAPLTIPAYADVPFPVGTQIDLGQEGDGVFSVEPDTGVTLNSEGGKRTLADRFLPATLVKTATDTWTLYGSLVA